MVAIATVTHSPTFHPQPPSTPGRAPAACWFPLANTGHGDCLHQQVVKSEKREGNNWHFLLHYSGWGKRYDEWVAQSGLVKYDADVVSLQP